MNETNDMDHIIQSVITIKGKPQSSFFYSSLQFVFENEIKNVYETDDKDTDILFSGNCSDLWKYLRMFRKKFTNAISSQDAILIDHSLLIGSIICLRDVYLKMEHNSKSRSLMSETVKNKINKQINKDIDWTIFQCTFVRQYLLTTEPFCIKEQYAQFKTQFILLKMSNVNIIKRYLIRVLDYLYRKINEIENSSDMIERNKMQILLICCYLKLYLGCQSWINLTMANSSISKLVFKNIASINGSKKIIRFTEDTLTKQLQDQLLKTMNSFQ